MMSLSPIASPSDSKIGAKNQESYVYVRRSTKVGGTHKQLQLI